MRELKYRVWGVDINGEGECKMWFVPDIRDTDTSRRVLSELEDNDVMELNPWMQYTGLKDRHGVEIYEGDVVKLADVFDEVESFAVEYEHNGYWIKGWAGNEYGFPDASDIEVIGNIYEHPELKEQTNDQL